MRERYSMDIYVSTCEKKNCLQVNGSIDGDEMRWDGIGLDWIGLAFRTLTAKSTQCNGTVKTQMTDNAQQESNMILYVCILAAVVWYPTLFCFQFLFSLSLPPTNCPNLIDSTITMRRLDSIRVETDFTPRQRSGQIDIQRGYTHAIGREAQQTSLAAAVTTEELEFINSPQTHSIQCNWENGNDCLRHDWLTVPNAFLLQPPVLLLPLSMSSQSSTASDAAAVSQAAPPPSTSTSSSSSSTSTSTAITPAGKRCSLCQVHRPVEEYSGAQLKKQGKRVCMRCISETTKKGTLPGIKDGGCYLIRTNPNEANRGAPVVHLYQDLAHDQFMILSNPGEPAPTLNASGHLTFEGVAGVTSFDQPKYMRFPVGHSQYCARPWCTHWQPSMILDTETREHAATPPKELIQCTVCQSVFYCSVECQTKHRLTHGLFCAKKKFTVKPKPGASGNTKSIMSGKEEGKTTTEKTKSKAK